MNTEELQTFIDHYSSADFDKIKFDWNGQHGDKFHDSNYEFRMKLCEFIVPQMESTKLELIRDLYMELSKHAKEAWGVYGKYHLFAQELLIRGGTTYIMDYLNGAGNSFDTALASGRVQLSNGQKQVIQNFIMEKLSTERDERIVKMLQMGHKRFKIK